MDVEVQVKDRSRKSTQVKRANITLRPDPSRVLIRPFSPTSEQRVIKICARALDLEEQVVSQLLEQILEAFGVRHLATRDLLKHRFEQVKHFLLTDKKLSEDRMLLLGAHFTHEYSLEAAALFNPSIVPHPDQSGLPSGSLRFVLSLRATGEGHISSVTFRTGILDARGNISVNEPTRYCLEPDQVPNLSYERDLFARKLAELGLAGDFSRHIFSGLGDHFTLEDLRHRVEAAAGEWRVRDQDT